MQRQEEQREVANQPQIRRVYIGRREILEENVDRRLNIPQLTNGQMRKVKVGLSDLFRSELNARMK
jgi:hypothetical protein